MRALADKVEYEIVNEPGTAMLGELVAYWDAKRAGRLAPPRAAIDPVEIPKHLPHLFMLDVVDAGSDFRFRLIGTEIVQGLGRDSTGRRFSELFQDQPESRARLLSRFTLVVQEKRPRFSRGRIFWHADKTHCSFRAVSVPLSDDGSTVNIILSELVLVPS
jgi:hypothetical protein